jgi:hypothetical protein
MKPLEDLVERVKTLVTSEEDKALAVALATDLAGLMAKQLAGEDVTAELRHTRAQALNLSAAMAADINAEVSNWISSLLSATISKLVGNPF